VLPCYPKGIRAPQSCKYETDRPEDFRSFLELAGSDVSVAAAAADLLVVDLRPLFRRPL